MSPAKGQNIGHMEQNFWTVVYLNSLRKKFENDRGLVKFLPPCSQAEFSMAHDRPPNNAMFQELVELAKGKWKIGPVRLGSPTNEAHHNSGRFQDGSFVPALRKVPSSQSYLSSWHTIGLELSWLDALHHMYWGNALVVQNHKTWALVPSAVSFQHIHCI